jgi:hypothetical protein
MYVSDLFQGDTPVLSTMEIVHDAFESPPQKSCRNNEHLVWGIYIPSTTKSTQRKTDDEDHYNGTIIPHEHRSLTLKTSRRIEKPRKPWNGYYSDLKQALLTPSRSAPAFLVAHTLPYM